MSLHAYINSQLDSFLSSPSNTLWTYFHSLNAYPLILKTGCFIFHRTEFQSLCIHTKMFLMVLYECQSCFYDLPLYILQSLYVFTYFSQENLRSKMRNTTFLLMAFRQAKCTSWSCLWLLQAKETWFCTCLCPCIFVRVYSALLFTQEIVSCNLSVLWGQALCFITPYGARNFSKGAATIPYFHMNFPQERLRPMSSLPRSPPFAWRTYCDFLCIGYLWNTLV